MTQDAGAIKYTVEAETGDLLSAEKVVDKTTTNMANDFKKVDVAVAKTNTQMTKTAKSVKTGMAGMGRGAGMAGIQFQQFIGQVQGGQGVMLALSQQSADLGFVLGAPLLGAIAGISASLIGILLPSLLKSSEATKDFKFNVEDMAKELKNLDDLSKSQVAIGMRDTSKSMDELSKAAEKSGKKIAKLNEQIGSKRVKSGRASTRLATAAESKELIDQVNQEKANLDKINQEYKKQSDLLVKLSANKSGYSKEEQKAIDATNELSSGLEAQVIALRDGEEAAFRYATAQQLNLKAGEQLPESIDKQIAAIFRLKAAQDDARKEGVEKKKGVVFSESVIARGQTRDQKLADELERLEELRATDLENTKLHEDAITAIKKEAGDAQAKNTINSQNIMAGAILGFISSTTSALMAGMDEQSGAYKVLFAIQKASSIASTIVNTETAATAAMASMPGPAGIALSSVVRGLGYASAGIIAGTAIAGGRQFGGQTQPGSNYRVNEGGVPEIMSSGGKDYLMNSPGGNVKQLDEISGGGATTININNMASGVDVQATPSQDGKTIDIAVRRAVAEITNQVATGNGKFINTLRSSTNLTTKATR